MEDNNREYTNGEITVYWKPALCTHATTCFAQLPQVFNLRKRPWVNMQGATSEEIIKIVKRCPSEALLVKWNKDIEAEKNKPQTIEATTIIKLMKNGPYLISGNFKILDSDGIEMDFHDRASLCRCGQSAKMPLCDGTHRKIEFNPAK